MNTNGIVIQNTELQKANVSTLIPSSTKFKEELLVLMATTEDLGAKRILNKIDKLLDAKTTDKQGNIIDDNEAQIKALSLLLKLQGMNVGSSGININLFNIPPQHENLRY